MFISTIGSDPPANTALILPHPTANKPPRGANKAFRGAKKDDNEASHETNIGEKVDPVIVVNQVLHCK